MNAVVGPEAIVPGFTYLNVLSEQPHLWFVASTPTENGEVVLFMLSTRRSGADLSCIIQPGEHPWLTRETVVVYRLGEIQTVNWICKLVENGFAKIKDAMPPALLQRAQQAALESKYTPRRIQKLIRRTLEDT